MQKKLYFKLYFYVFIILVLSIFFTSITITLYFQYYKENIFNNNINEPRNIFFRQFKITKLYLIESSKLGENKFKNTLLEVSKILNCSISYWKEDKPYIIYGEIPYLDDFIIKKLKTNKEVNIPPIHIFYLDKNDDKKGFIIISFEKRQSLKSNIFKIFDPYKPPHPRGNPFELPVPPIIFTLFFLALLLIPFTAYILKPLKNILYAIEQISKGNLTYPIPNVNNEFKDLFIAFERMQKKIVKIIKQKEELIAAVSHELRSPLTRLRMCFELIKETCNCNNIEKEYINQGIEEIKDLDKLIENLLILSKLELNTAKLNIEDININELLLDYINKYNVLLSKQNISLITNLPNKPIYIKGDKELLKIVFNNLFSNILNYAPINSDANISLIKIDNSIKIIFKNKGKNLSEQEKEKIFEPFYRLPKNLRHNSKGTGLGLAITKSIIEAHGGLIRAYNPQDNEIAIEIEFA